MNILICSFCKASYDMDAVPKPVVIVSKGPNGKVHICKSCVKGATEIIKQDPAFGPDWPKGKKATP